MPTNFFSFVPFSNIRRWHACKRKYLVDLKEIVVHVDPETDRTYMAKFEGLFRLFVQTIKQAGMPCVESPFCVADDKVAPSGSIPMARRCS